MAPLRILTYSSLYPNEAMPGHGLFVQQRLRHLTSTGAVEARVVAPVPWFPFRHPAFGGYSRFSRVPASEVRHGISLSHPRFLQIPKLGMSAAPWLMRVGTERSLQAQILDGFDFDLIDAHYFYPDGVAAVMLAERLKKPVLITARGSDVNLLAQFKQPRRMIKWAASRADALITVCGALKSSLIALGVPGDKITVLRNGVDLDLFQPVAQDYARETLKLEKNQVVLLSVGMLIESKGHDIPIRALRDLLDARLLIAGEGGHENALRELAGELGVLDRVTFLGAVPQERLKMYFSAANALVLASSREGWANVLLESMACGTPVIASNVGGTPEVVARPEAGILMEDRTAASFVDAYRELMSNHPGPDKTRKYAEQFSWDETTSGQLDIMHRVVKRAEKQS